MFKHDRTIVANIAWVAAVLLGVAAGIFSCSTAPTAFLVNGPGVEGNTPPTLTITEPVVNITRGQGDPFEIKWEDSDPDNNARISFALVDTTDPDNVISLVENLPENDSTGVDSFVVGTRLIPIGNYNLSGTINDGVNDPVTVFAQTNDTPSQNVLVRIVGPGEGAQSEPPTVAVVAPTFDLSVTQDDVVTIVVQPTPNAAANVPFDRDSDIILTVLLDVDQDPTNDDPANPESSLIIVLQRTTVATGTTTIPDFEITIDLTQVPARPNGEPYFVRATAQDAVNPPVSSYAPGTLSVVRLAAGTVDLFDVGRTLSGSKFYGFNPSANLGSNITFVTDFDADGIEDFMVAAQFGNPQNVGPVGEAYLIYGQDNIRFGGVISINTVSQSVSGAVFQAPPIRNQVIPDPNARTDGITDLGFIRDLSGDGRPELLFGLPHVHGAFDGTDYDPGDDFDEDAGPAFCYPDLLVNNFASEPSGLPDSTFYAGGMAIVVNSQNRDIDPRPAQPAPRLDTTSIALEVAGQRRVLLDSSGRNPNGNIFARADNVGVADGTVEPDEPTRVAGARFIAGGYDFVFQLEAPREGLYGHRIGFVRDLTQDGIDEIIVSAPRNERYLADIADDEPEGLPFSPHYFSTNFFGSISVFPGNNYNNTNWRDINDDSGSSVIGYLDQWLHTPFGSCTAPVEPRHYDIPAQAFQIFAEDIDDFLGDGQSAGDFNLDGLGDILCGAPRNDRSAMAKDTGATYVIYGRPVFGEILLDQANNPATRPPMIRVRGLQTGDQIGWAQTSGLDVNGDRIDDVFISSPTTDFGGIERATCGEDFNQDGVVDQNDFALLNFTDCQAEFGNEVFTDDACKAFDYDNDGDIDDDDRCVLCCLSDDCDPEDSCVLGRGTTCCENMVDNGFAAVIFGGRFLDGDRVISQIATTDLPGTIFYGGGALHRAGTSVNSAGDFNQDGFGDLLISVPGEIRLDSAERERVGVVYLVFGGTHLQNTVWNLSDPDTGVGSDDLPGIVFLSPYVAGRPNEAAPIAASGIGDINNDGFDDIAIGNPKADFIDLSFPQGPSAPGDDPAAGRRSNTGDMYIVYGNNFGSNR